MEYSVTKVQFGAKSTLPVEPHSEVINKLLTCEKMLGGLAPQYQKHEERLHYQFKNAFMLLLVYSRNNETQKILKYIESVHMGSKFKDNLEKLS